MKRREAREKAFQFLFQIDINQDIQEQIIRNYFDETGNDPYIEKLVNGIIEKRVELDHTIACHLENWSLDRLPSVERTLLRLATFEIIYLDDIPNNVSINEAVVLGNRYGDEKSGKFINGVLSKIVRKEGNEK